MGDYFKPWPKKFGVVTLLTASVFMAGWVRSGETFDFVNLGGNETSCTFGSMGGRFRWFWTTPPNRTGIHWESGKLTNIMQFKTNAVGKREYRDVWENYDVEWRRDWAGFHFGAAVLPTDGVRKTVRIEAYEFPYWSITIPLTLIAFWLFLSKPRKLTQKRSLETLSEKFN